MRRYDLLKVIRMTLEAQALFFFSTRLHISYPFLDFSGMVVNHHP